MDLIGHRAGCEEGDRLVDVIIRDAQFPILSTRCPVSPSTLHSGKDCSYVADAPGAVEYQRRDTDETTLDAVLLEEPSDFQDLIGPMAATGWDFVW